jgi:hypothetical protein
MTMATPVRRRLLPLAIMTLSLIMALTTAASPYPVRAAEPGPEWVTPRNDEDVPYLNDLVFQVQPIPGADSYLYAFSREDGAAVWENYANERHLDGTTYVLPVGSPGHRALGSIAEWRVSWPLILTVRGYINDGYGDYHWSEESQIRIRLVGYGCIYTQTGGCDY